jgi:hypothetical protein
LNYSNKSGMNTLENKYDSLESLIFQEGLRIEMIDIHQDLDLFLVILNTKAILRQKISAFPRLKDATEEKLKQYELIGNGTGVHWPELDEDLSLKGFLRNELKNLVGNANDAIAA